jgi:hypothetical protein
MTGGSSDADLRMVSEYFIKKKIVSGCKIKHKDFWEEIKKIK